MKNVLVIDDERTVGMILRFNLKHTGYNVFTAINSAEGIEIAKRDRIDIFILDVSIPGMNGIEICRYLRSMREYRNTPILMISSHSDDKTRNSAREAGASRYITKPFTFDELSAEIESLLAS